MLQLAGTRHRFLSLFVAPAAAPCASLPHPFGQPHLCPTLLASRTQGLLTGIICVMSRAAKITLGASILGSALIIWGVHHLQTSEREVRPFCVLDSVGLTRYRLQTMYQGVIRDDERRREKMRQREEDLQRSIEKRELYERVQAVSSPATDPTGSR